MYEGVSERIPFFHRLASQRVKILSKAAFLFSPAKCLLWNRVVKWCWWNTVDKGVITMNKIVPAFFRSKNQVRYKQPSILMSSSIQCWSQNFMYLTQKTKICYIMVPSFYNFHFKTIFILIPSLTIYYKKCLDLKVSKSGTKLLSRNFFQKANLRIRSSILKSSQDRKTNS